jgi:hypothetical protein
LSHFRILPYQIESDSNQCHENVSLQTAVPCQKTGQLAHQALYDGGRIASPSAHKQMIGSR